MVSSNKLYRKVIHITALDSPNVRLALAQRSAGIPITDEILVPGVLSYQEYLHRRATWDKVRQTIGLDGQFYEGAEVLLYPIEWINRAHRLAEPLRGKHRKAGSLGIDPGEGSARSSWCLIDDKGVVELISKVTADTSVIIGDTKALIQRYQLDCSNVCIDRGGGGKQIADILRRDGFPIRTIAFGEAISLPPKNMKYQPRMRKALLEERYSYLNRRAQMYGDLRQLLDPSINLEGFAIPVEYFQLRKQMAVIPLHYDGEGRMILPSKHKKPSSSGNSNIKTLIDIIGESPDELDSLVLAVHGLLHPDSRPKVGPAWKG